MIYSLDSDTISYMLKDNRDIQEKFNNTIANNNDYSISPIVYYEVKRGLTEKKAYKKLREFNYLYDDSLKGDMTMEIWEKAIEIWIMLKSKGRLIGDGDILIASFCIVNDYTLITNNTKHYDNITELKKINIV
jgi:predicted nucleic acid-binding protein